MVYHRTKIQTQVLRKPLINTNQIVVTEVSDLINDFKVKENIKLFYYSWTGKDVF